MGQINPNSGNTSLGLITLKKRAQFLRLRGGARWANRLFVLETKPRRPKSERAPKHLPSSAPDNGQFEVAAARNAGVEIAASTGPAQFGFTITKRIGNAVTRNRVRRRLKEALRRLTVTYAKAGYDYVVIARHDIVGCDFAQLTRELKTALERVHAPRSKRPQTKRAPPSRRPRP